MLKEFKEEELNRIFSWLPYREDWPVDRNQKEDNISGHYGDLINNLTENKVFDAYYSADGGLRNYLEFICYPKSHDEYDGNAILVCVSLCSPIAAYGQIRFHKTLKSCSWEFIRPDTIGVISDKQLLVIEKEVKDILQKNSLELIDQEFASQILPKTIADGLKGENHNEGNQYLHGLFQIND